MRVHFIGIGGIGVSSLAQYYLAQGWRVSGSDAVKSEITTGLKRKGIKISIGQRAANIPPAGGPDLVVYSAAVKADNPELAAAVSAKIKTLTYAQAVGELTRQYKTITGIQCIQSNGKHIDCTSRRLYLIDQNLGKRRQTQYNTHGNKNILETVRGIGYQLKI